MNRQVRAAQPNVPWVEDFSRVATWQGFVRVAFVAAWHNNRRPLEPIGDVPPAEAEARYYARLEPPAMAA